MVAPFFDGGFHELHFLHVKMWRGEQQPSEAVAAMVADSLDVDVVRELVRDLFLDGEQRAGRRALVGEQPVLYCRSHTITTILCHNIMQ